MKRRSNTVNLGNWLNGGLTAISRLERDHSSSLYALASHALLHPTSWIISHPEYELNPNEKEKLDSLLLRLVKGEPLPYITGKQAFYGLEFLINPCVLIPRPETELLVEIAIERSGQFQTEIAIADVGTGSGCIAIAIQKTIKQSKTTATDISFDALRVAKMNVDYHNIKDHIQLVQTDLLNGINKKFHVICANLPYIPSNTLMNLDVIKYEPRSALDGGGDGLDHFRRLLRGIRHKLHPDGTIILEIEQSQSEQIINLSKSIAPHTSIKIFNDLAGFPRTAVINFTDR